ncbi:putative phosphatase SPAC5H10.03 [Exaiptasia diaphana]|nr:putative phosphatase SPAC5H10.03 [Exaiptasia diaphana]
MFVRFKVAFFLVCIIPIIFFIVILRKMSFQLKQIHFVRHAESTFNEIHHRNTAKPAPRDLSLIDAPLSAKGEQQAKQLKEQISKLNVDLAICSPFQRAMSTCLLAHGSRNVLISPLCSERLESVCDIGTTKDVLVKNYPYWDFRLVENNVWWYVGQQNITDQESAIKWWQSDDYSVESDEVLKDRASRFYHLLLSRPERSIAVFSHSHFLRKFLRWHFGVQNINIQNAEVVSLPLPNNN